MDPTVVADLAQACADNVPVRDVQMGLNIYLQCFKGKDLLKVAGEMIAIRNDQVDPRVLCCELLRIGLLVGVDSAEDVFTVDRLFRFNLATKRPATPPKAEPSSISAGEKGKAMFIQMLSDHTEESASQGSSSGEHRQLQRMTPWSAADDEQLTMAVMKYGENWGFVAYTIPGRNEEECESRWIQKLLEADTQPAHKDGSFLRFLKKKKHQPHSGLQHTETLTSEYLKRRERMRSDNTALSRVSEGNFEASSSLGFQALALHDHALTKVPEELNITPTSSSSSSGKRDKKEDRKSLPVWRSPKPDAAKLIQEQISLADTPVNILLICRKVLHPPFANRPGLRESHYYVTVHYGNGCQRSTKPVVYQPTSGVSWNQVLNVEGVTLKTKLEFRLYIKHRFVRDEEMGRTEITVGDLAKRPWLHLVLSDSSARPVTSENAADLTLIHVGLDKNTRPAWWPYPVSSPHETKKYDKHLMVFTRGTRGDVQPFIALARGLANKYNWMITICTELRYRDYVKSYSTGLENGAIRFRISGGDTQKRVDSKISKWAMNLRSQAMQHIMLAFSEAEFFDSEPALFYWAKTMKPDYLMFGFTMASVAMLVSEALKIPIIGFILQPTCIPSNQYPPVVTLDEAAYNRMSALEGGMDSKHELFASLKVLAENNPFTLSVNTMRKRRGLGKIKRFTGGSKLMYGFQSLTWVELQEQNIPLIMPINELAFGGKPKDWGEKSVLTNYIFLRGSTVPPLSDGQKQFIETARKNSHKIICLAFSSMPVERLDILRIAIRIITECQEKVCVFALIGDHTDDPERNEEIESKAELLTKQSRLFVDKGAPFGRLFPCLDAIVAHGGLGTTGEAIMSGVPVIITGVLLFDQRFWGSRVSDLGIGGFPVHISKFYKHCVPLIDKALAPGSEWAVNAKKIGHDILESMLDDPSGVEINIDTVKQMAEKAPYFSYVRRKRSLFGGHLSSSSSEPGEHRSDAAIV